MVLKLIKMEMLSIDGMRLYCMNSVSKRLSEVLALDAQLAGFGRSATECSLLFLSTSP